MKNNVFNVMIEDKTVHKLLKKAKRTFRRFTSPESVPCYTIFWFWQNSSSDYFVNIIDKQQGSQTERLQDFLRFGFKRITKQQGSQTLSAFHARNRQFKKITKQQGSQTY